MDDDVRQVLESEFQREEPISRTKKQIQRLSTLREEYQEKLGKVLGDHADLEGRQREILERLQRLKDTAPESVQESRGKEKKTANKVETNEKESVAKEIAQVEDAQRWVSVALRNLLKHSRQVGDSLKALSDDQVGPEEIKQVSESWSSFDQAIKQCLQRDQDLENKILSNLLGCPDSPSPNSLQKVLEKRREVCLEETSSALAAKFLSSSSSSSSSLPSSSPGGGPQTLLDTLENNKLKERITEIIMTRRSAKFLEGVRANLQQNLKTYYMTVPHDLNVSSPHRPVSVFQISELTLNFVTFIRSLFSQPKDAHAESQVSSILDQALQLWRLTLVHHLKLHVPIIIGTFFNDCAFVIKSLESLSLCVFALGIDSPHQIVKVILKEIESINRMQTQKLDDFFKTQVREIEERVTSVGLQSSSNPEKKHRIQQSFEFAILQLDGLDKTWEDVLSTETKTKWMSGLVQAIYKTVLEQLHEITDFPEDETHSLHSLLSDFFRRTLSVVSKDQTLENVSKSVSPDASDWQKSVARFANSIDFLELSMVQIVERYTEGSLRNCFSADEVRWWIKALFSDTTFRQNNLSRIV